MKLHTYGLMRDPFRLQQDMEYVRTIWRLRDRHVKDAGREVQHMQKALTKMNIQLANVISDISGLSGQAIITAVLQGERDPYKLADLADYRVKASREEVARSLLTTSAAAPVYLSPDKVCRRSRPWSKRAGRGVVRTATGR
jgi:DNA-binding protein YbaB